jgi:uncharacterized damage-inducible protein DinB
MQSDKARAWVAQLQHEAVATRRCLERIPESAYRFKPHPKSMSMGYLTLLVAEIPLWIAHNIESGEIDFATYQSVQPTSTEEMLERFDYCLEKAIAALQKLKEEDLQKTFTLRNNRKVLLSLSWEENIVQAIHHWVHHRGQLTVYMRLNDIAVPSIYGPSADEKVF